MLKGLFGKNNGYVSDTYSPTSKLHTPSPELKNNKDVIDKIVSDLDNTNLMYNNVLEQKKDMLASLLSNKKEDVNHLDAFNSLEDYISLLEEGMKGKNDVYKNIHPNLYEHTNQVINGSKNLYNALDLSLDKAYDIVKERERTLSENPSSFHDEEKFPF